jgi:hypothetical protein
LDVVATSVMAIEL